MKNKKNSTRESRSSGFTLFVAMVVSSLLLAVGFSIGNIILKQLLLAGSGKDSQIAFYAADSGSECVQFWDVKNADGTNVLDDGPFSASSTVVAATPTPIPIPTENATIRCGAGKIYASKMVSFDAATSTLIIDYSNNTDGYPSCAKVVIAKGYNSATDDLGNTENVPYTRIISRGYNSGVTADKIGCNTANPRTVERGLDVQY